uniref:Cryptochrome-1 n=1 Tax=Aphrocallistes vastus TaxID=83887 RepID=Q86RA1_APHVA|nr:photolyase related protein [Aphrocallistes vastus]
MESLSITEFSPSAPSPISSSSSPDEETDRDIVAKDIEQDVEPQGKVLLHIFNNRHLRLKDNTALYQAMAQNPDKFYAVYIFDGFDSKPVAPVRWQFLIDCLEDLKEQLNGFGLELYCFRGETIDVLATLVQAWKVKLLSINMDPDVNFTFFNEKIVKMCTINAVQLYNDMDSHRLLYLPPKYKSAIPMSKFRVLLAEAITAKQNNLESEAKIQDITPPLNPEQLSDLGNKPRLDSPLPSEIPKLNALFTEEEIAKLNFIFQGGERRTEDYLNEYREARLRDVSGDEDASPIAAKAMGISPHLRFGCITPRHLFNFLVKTIKDANYSRIKINKVLAGIMARDFALQVSQLQTIPERIISLNKICLPIPWDKNNNEIVEKLTDAQTGFPFFDAAITQLKTEGYVINEVSEALATFVTNSLLWVSWEEGQNFFSQHLICFDLAMSTHSWLEASGSTMVTGRQKSYQDPLLFVSKKLDPNGEYIKRYLPKFINFPIEFIHKPGNASLEAQQAANCVIDIDYPKPLFEYECRNGICCKRLRVFMEVVDSAAKATKLPHVIENCSGKFP